MKAICVAVFLALAVAEISAGSGYYVPKAFYTIDQNGQASPVFTIGDSHKEALNRFRRSPQGVASSSSSSSSSFSDGGPVYFSQQTAVHSSGPRSFSTRFGGDDYSSGGQYTQTSGVVDYDGKVYYKTNSGRF